VALSGTKPAATWGAGGTFSATTALSGTKPAATWTVPALALAPGPVALVAGARPVATWGVAAIGLSGGSVFVGADLQVSDRAVTVISLATTEVTDVQVTDVLLVTS
jgi:hypothetical protein